MGGKQPMKITAVGVILIIGAVAALVLIANALGRKPNKDQGPNNNDKTN
jgi:hypothetical protein